MRILRVFWGGYGLAAVAAACLTALAPPARAQVSAAGDKGALLISAGATGTADQIQYGDRKMLGITGFIDADTRRRLGIEAEGRWIEYHQTADVHLETYSIGARYHFDARRFEPYAKGLIGVGDFNFTHNDGSGSYLVLTAGGGVDFRLSSRWYARADFEYQDWPQFSYGAAITPMNTFTGSAGLRVRIF